MSRTVLDMSFQSVRAKVADVDSELQRTKQEKRIVFGPGAREKLGEPDAAE